MSFGSDAQGNVLVQHSLEVTTKSVELSVDLDGESARIEAVAINVPRERVLEGEQLLRLRQFSLVLETDHVWGLEVALGMLVGIAARADLVVEFGRLKWTNLKIGKK